MPSLAEIGKMGGNIDKFAEHFQNHSCAQNVHQIIQYHDAHLPL